MNMKFINIVDPTFQKNNLGKSISKINASRIKYGLNLQQKRLAALYDQSLKAELAQGTGAELLLKGLLKMFQVTFECIGAQPVLSLLLPQIVQRGLEALLLFEDDFESESFSGKRPAEGRQLTRFDGQDEAAPMLPPLQ
jgi:hypothetical protein